MKYEYEYFDVQTMREPACNYSAEKVIHWIPARQHLIGDTIYNPIMLIKYDQIYPDIIVRKFETKETNHVAKNYFANFFRFR